MNERRVSSLAYSLALAIEDRDSKSVHRLLDSPYVKYCKVKTGNRFASDNSLWLDGTDGEKTERIALRHSEVRWFKRLKLGENVKFYPLNKRR